MDDAQATPPPNISDDSSAEMDTDEEDAILYTGLGGQPSDHSNDSLEHV